MTKDEWNSVDPARSKLRAYAASVEREIVELGVAVGGTPHAAQVGAVTRAWRQLADSLALGEEPELRACPHCGRAVVRDATRCRYCMRSSAAEPRG